MGRGMVQEQVGNWILLSFVFFYLPTLFVERPSEIGRVILALCCRNPGSDVNSFGCFD